MADEENYVSIGSSGGISTGSSTGGGSEASPYTSKKKKKKRLSTSGGSGHKKSRGSKGSRGSRGGNGKKKKRSKSRERSASRGSKKNGTTNSRRMPGTGEAAPVDPSAENDSDDDNDQNKDLLDKALQTRPGATLSIENGQAVIVTGSQIDETAYASTTAQRGGGMNFNDDDIAAAYASTTSTLSKASSKSNLKSSPQVFPEFADGRRDTEIIAAKGPKNTVLTIDPLAPSYKEIRKAEKRSRYLDPAFIRGTETRITVYTVLIFLACIALLFYSVLTIAGLGTVWGEGWQYYIAGGLGSLVALMGLYTISTRSHPKTSMFKYYFVPLAAFFFIFDMLYLFASDDQFGAGDIGERCSLFTIDPEFCEYYALYFGIGLTLFHIIAFATCFCFTRNLQLTMEDADKTMWAIQDEHEYKQKVEERERLASTGEVIRPGDVEVIRKISRPEEEMYKTPPPGVLQAYARK